MNDSKVARRRLFAPKHQHQWKLTGARYHPRPDSLRHVTGVEAEAVQDVLFGFTLLTQQCTECGWVETSRTPGRPDLGVEWGLS